MIWTTFANLLVIYTMKFKRWSQENPQGNFLTHSRQSQRKEEKLRGMMLVSLPSQLELGLRKGVSRASSHITEQAEQRYIAPGAP